LLQPTGLNTYSNHQRNLSAVMCLSEPTKEPEHLPHFHKNLIWIRDSYLPELEC